MSFIVSVARITLDRAAGNCTSSCFLFRKVEGLRRELLFLEEESVVGFFTVLKP